MQNAKFALSGLLLLGVTALTGCSFFPGLYKIDVQQGNMVTQDMINQLKPGMTKRQVRFIMGTPLLQDTFHPNRWDYLFSIQPGGRTRYQDHVSLVFQDDQLMGLAGDFMPGVSRDEAIMGNLPVVPEPEVRPGDLEPPPKTQDVLIERVPVGTPAPKGSTLEQIEREVNSEDTPPPAEPPPPMVPDMEEIQIPDAPPPGSLPKVDVPEPADEPAAPAH